MCMCVCALLMCVPVRRWYHRVSNSLETLNSSSGRKDEEKKGEKGGFTTGLVFTSSPATLFSCYHPIFLLSSLPSNTYRITLSSPQTSQATLSLSHSVSILFLLSLNRIRNHTPLCPIYNHWPRQVRWFSKIIDKSQLENKCIVNEKTCQNSQPEA